MNGDETQEMIDEFVIAAHHDLPKVQQMLADHPGLLNENATWVETPLGAAAHVGNHAIAEFLLRQGAPLDICAAAMMGLTQEMAAFLDDDPGLIEATGAHGIPLMFHAVLSGNLDVLHLLLERGADVNSGAGMNTALHAAALRGYTDIARDLLAHGADPEAQDHQGRPPLDIAEANGNTAMVALLRSALYGE